jgi:hypothetical protein
MKLYIVKAGAKVTLIEQKENKNTVSTIITDRPYTFREYETEYSIVNDEYHFFSKKIHYYVQPKSVQVFN